MNTTSAPPSPQVPATLKVLQDAVSKSLEKKQKIGQYAVTWQDGRPVQSGANVAQAKDGFPERL